MINFSAHKRVLHSSRILNHLHYLKEQLLEQLDMAFKYETTFLWTTSRSETSCLCLFLYLSLCKMYNFIQFYDMIIKKPKENTNTCKNISWSAIVQCHGNTSVSKYGMVGNTGKRSQVVCLQHGTVRSIRKRFSNPKWSWRGTHKLELIRNWLSHSVNRNFVQKYMF